MIQIKNSEQLALMKQAGQITGEALLFIRDKVRAGVSTYELDRLIRQFIEKHGAKPSFLNYSGFPASACISINDEVIHGIGRDDVVLKEDDIVSIDLGIKLDGALADTALTFGFHEQPADIKRLLDGTRNALMEGIAAARCGAFIHDISAAVEKCARRHKLAIVRDFVGHGCGIQLHEPPQIPNYTGTGRGPRLEPGMVLCIEPMLNLGTESVKVDRKDKWTVRTRDGAWSAHFEHMILITENEPEILTWQKTM